MNVAVAVATLVSPSDISAVMWILRPERLVMRVRTTSSRCSGTPLSYRTDSVPVNAGAPMS